MPCINTAGSWTEFSTSAEFAWIHNFYPECSPKNSAGSPAIQGYYFHTQQPIPKSGARARFTKVTTISSAAIPYRYRSSVQHLRNSAQGTPIEVCWNDQCIQSNWQLTQQHEATNQEDLVRARIFIGPKGTGRKILSGSTTSTRKYHCPTSAIAGKSE